MLPADRAAYVRRLRELLGRRIGHATRWFDVIEDLVTVTECGEEVREVGRAVGEADFHGLRGDLANQAVEVQRQ